ncbi:hypothetical protein [Edaphobacter albus]|uniref:hypothetical protein n=1 Tax=Edaphobacter sp. 4G125 TaxID=2763071 RepID=UPI001644A2C1|nr:hypothetical protein [Edaphobacter sp. 4G125]QNI37431.1 hypothetical protein H7846_03710 [Edaphobacter sp. 4G125]
MMKSFVALLVLLGFLIPSALYAQASAIPSAAVSEPKGSTQEQVGKKLLDEMVEALGGEVWLNRKDMQVSGRTAAFYRGAPNGTVIEYTGWRRFPDAAQSGAERIGFLTPKGMIVPGKKIDVVQIWTNGNGYEVTYKGKTTLPKDQVADYYRRQDHSIESIVRNWIKAPGVMILAEGTTMVERRIADKVSVLSANNDAVTLELDATTHLPLRRTFRWRNETFNDFDEEAETYDDYHTVQGIPTPYNVTRYRNGDMVNQRFLTKVTYNQNLSPDLFNPDNLLKKK